VSPARIWTLLKLDAKLALRHRLVHVTVLVALVFGGLVGFALPASVDGGGVDYLMDESPGGQLAELLEQSPEDRVFASREQLRAAVEDEGESIGVVFEGSAERPRATVFIQGSESPARRALIETGVDSMWHHVGGSGVRPPAAIEPTILDPGAQKPAFNELFISILFALDLCLLGFMFGAVMVLQDKQQGTIRAYRVGPGTTRSYLAAKLTVNLGLSTLNLLILVGLGAPRLLAEPAIYPLILLCCAGMTALGMGLAVFVRGIAQFFYPLMVVGLVGALPMYQVFAPSPALAWTRWLPTHHALFGSEAIFFTHDATVVGASLSYALVFAAVSVGFCALATHTRLMKEAG
jgi:ABC-2 type transport system permease protein/fluoroquinolone transport system permease protein